MKSKVDQFFSSKNIFIFFSLISLLTIIERPFSILLRSSGHSSLFLFFFNIVLVLLVMYFLYFYLVSFLFVVIVFLFFKFKKLLFNFYAIEIGLSHWYIFIPFFIGLQYGLANFDSLILKSPIFFTLFFTLFLIFLSINTLSYNMLFKHLPFYAYLYETTPVEKWRDLYVASLCYIYDHFSDHFLVLGSRVGYVYEDFLVKNALNTLGKLRSLYDEKDLIEIKYMNVFNPNFTPKKQQIAGLARFGYITVTIGHLIFLVQYFFH